MNFSVKLTDDDLDALAERLLERLPKADTGSPWLTIKPAAEYLGTTEQALRKAAFRNQVPHYQPGGRKGRLIFSKDELNAFVTG